MPPLLCIFWIDKRNGNGIIFLSENCEVIALSDKSIVEQMICSRDFPYLQPYFYNHPYALRCELGIGSTAEEYMDSAKKRALEIYEILFPNGADAIMFNHWICDDCDSGEAECQNHDTEESFDEIVAWSLECAVAKLRFLLEHQFRYRHVTIRNLPTYDHPEDDLYELQRRNRVICYSDGIGFDHQHLIEQEFDWNNGHEVSFVSFENECIFSVYDDRGCDVVFMTHEKLKEFYGKLQPYFLEYDITEMDRRFNCK